MFWNTGVTHTNINKLLLLCGIILSAMLLPSIEIRESLPRVRLDDALIFGAFALNLLLVLIRRTRNYTYDYQPQNEGERSGLRTVNLVFLLFLAAIIISNLYAVVFLNGSVGLRDAMEGVTLLKYYLIITLALTLDLQGTEFETLRSTFLVGLGIILIISWSQFLNLGNVNEWLTPFFAPAHLNNLVNANPPRVLGTFDNPNVMGIISVLMMTLFVTWFYFRRNDRFQSVILFIAIGLTLKLTFMTISRTALLATAAVLVFLSIWSTFKFNWNKGILIKILILFLLTLTLFFTSPRDFVTRMSEATNLETSTSAQGHLLSAGDAFKLIKQSPIIGWGTAKNTMTTYVDNEYALVARRYGVIGLAMYLWLFIRPAIAALRRIRSYNFFTSQQGLQQDKTLLAIAFVASTLAIFVYNITAGTFYNLQLMSLVALFMGIIYRIEGEYD